MKGDPASLQHALQAALDSKDSQRCAQALVRAAEEASRSARDGHRPDRITLPSGSLPPLP